LGLLEPESNPAAYRTVSRKKPTLLLVLMFDALKLNYFQSLLEKYYATARKDGKGRDYKGFTAYEDYKEILGRKDIDAVVISTPDHWHAVQAIQAYQCGKTCILRKAPCA